MAVLHVDWESLRKTERADQHLLKSVLLGVMRLSLSEPGLGPFLEFCCFSAVAAAQVTASEHPHRLLMLWPALWSLPAVNEAAPLCIAMPHLHA